MSAERSGNVVVGSWQPEPIPYQLQFVWNWFLELHMARTFNAKGRPMSITYHDMVNWSTLTERKLTPFVIRLIRQLDQRYFYVLSNPMGVAPSKYLDKKQVDNDVASALRALRALKNPGMKALPVPKEPSKSIQVPTLTFKSSKRK